MTDMRRGACLFEAMPESRALVDKGIEVDGSLLSGVSAHIAWERSSVGMTYDEPELCHPLPMAEVHLQFNMEALQLWPLAIRYVQLSATLDV